VEGGEGEVVEVASVVIVVVIVVVVGVVVVVVVVSGRRRRKRNKLSPSSTNTKLIIWKYSSDGDISFKSIPLPLLLLLLLLLLPLQQVLMNSSTEYSLLRGEMEIQRRLCHKNIIRLFGGFTDEVVVVVIFTDEVGEGCNRTSHHGMSRLLMH